MVLDLISGAVVFVGDGKGAEALLPFWKRLKCSRAQIQAVAIDMSPVYISAVSANLPEATIVFDHFHLIKLFNEKLSTFRRDLHHEATKEGKKVLKGMLWLLLKNPNNLRPQHDEKQRLEEALNLNKSLATAYYLKEDLRQLWFQENKKQATDHLDDWIARAKSSNIKMLLTFSKTFVKHRNGILAYYDFPISTGPLEGTNNKIKTLQKQAYGFRDEVRSNRMNLIFIQNLILKHFYRITITQRKPFSKLGYNRCQHIVFIDEFNSQINKTTIHTHFSSFPNSNKNSD